MQTLLRYMEKLDHSDTYLLFEALKYLTMLLANTKFSSEFLSLGGLEKLIKIPRLSFAATGVSAALLNLTQSDDAMERICSMSQKLVSEVVS